MKITRNMALFSVGGGSYVALELLWRGRSHVSMFAAGGTCFLLLGKLRRLPPLAGVIAGAGMITAVELAAGLLVNWDHRIWDYRKLPGNFRGQICLPFSLLWIPVSLLGMHLYTLAEEALERI